MRRRFIILTALLALGLPLCGCSKGAQPQTLIAYAAADGLRVCALTDGLSYVPVSTTAASTAASTTAAASTELTLANAATTAGTTKAKTATAATTTEPADPSTVLVRSRHIDSPRFTENGQYIVYNNSSDLFCIRLSDGRIGMCAANAVLAGEYGGKLICVSPDGGVTLYSPDDGLSTTLAAKPEDGEIRYAAVSPDGQRTIYTLRRTDAGRETAAAFCVTVPGASVPESQTPEELFGDAAVIPKPMLWCGDELILFCARDGAESGSLWAYSISEGAAAKLCDSCTPGAAFSASADGGKLLTAAYQSSADTVLSLLRIDVAARTGGFLPSGYLGIAGAALSPSGASAAYCSATEEIADGLYVFDNEKTLAIARADGGKYVYPRYDDNGANLFVLDVAGESGVLCLCPANSAGVRRLIDGITPRDGTLEGWSGRFDIYEP